MSEESRFGREQIESEYLFKQIAKAGVRVFFSRGSRAHLGQRTPVDAIPLFQTLDGLGIEDPHEDRGATALHDLPAVLQRPALTETARTMLAVVC